MKDKSQQRVSVPVTGRKAHRCRGRHRSQSSDRAGETRSAEVLHDKEGFKPFSL